MWHGLVHPPPRLCVIHLAFGCNHGYTKSAGPLPKTIRRMNFLSNALRSLALYLSLAHFGSSCCGNARVAALKASVYTASLETVPSGIRLFEVTLESIPDIGDIGICRVGVEVPLTVIFGRDIEL